jgi:hypothetical protein
MSDFGFMGNSEMSDLALDPVSDQGLGTAVIPPITRAPEFQTPRYEGIPRSQLRPSTSGIGVLDDVTGSIGSLLNTQILGIPLWVIGLGVGGYFLFFHKPQKSAKRAWAEAEVD